MTRLEDIDLNLIRDSLEYKIHRDDGLFALARLRAKLSEREWPVLRAQKQEPLLVEIDRLIRLTGDPLVTTVDAAQVAALASRAMRIVNHLMMLVSRQRDWIIDTDLPPDIREVLEYLVSVECCLYPG